MYVHHKDALMCVLMCGVVIARPVSSVPWRSIQRQTAHSMVVCVPFRHCSLFVVVVVVVVVCCCLLLYVVVAVAGGGGSEEKRSKGEKEKGKYSECVCDGYTSECFQSIYLHVVSHTPKAPFEPKDESIA